MKEWLTWGTYREPAEFVESIPFNETREYVQAVLRNADMYRIIYGERHPDAADVKDLSDVPPVNLAVLPLAARTPGGGVKTAVARKAARYERRVKPGQLPNSVATTAATTKKSVAAKKNVVVDKKKDPA